MRHFLLPCLAVLVLASAGTARSTALCDFEVGGYSNLLNPGPGYFQQADFAILPGYDGLRLDALFLAPESDPEWHPLLKLMAVATDDKTYALRYGLETPEAPDLDLMLMTSGADGEMVREPLGITQPVTRRIRADLTWDGAGNITFTAYPTDKGFLGTSVTRVVHTGDVESVKVLVSTAKVDITSVRYGRACPVA